MAAVSNWGTDRQVDGETQETRRQLKGETQETRRVTIILGDEFHTIAHAHQEDGDHCRKESMPDQAGPSRSSASWWPPFFRCCGCVPCPFSCTESRTTPYHGLCTKLSEKCALRTLLLVYVCVNEVLRYHNETGAVSVAAAISETFLVFLLLLEFVYDSVSMGLWRGSKWFFRSRRCVYNLVVLVAAVTCGILDALVKIKPTWYTAQVALAVALGRFIRVFRVYQSQSFQFVHSIFKKSFFNLLALAGLGFLFALFYAIIFFHSYGYTQFNLCYKEPRNRSTSITSIQSSVDTFSKSITADGLTSARRSSANKPTDSKTSIDAPQNFSNDGFCGNPSSVKADLLIAPANSSGPAKELVCDANSAYWEFDASQQYLCMPGRVCQAGTTCRNTFFDPWTSVCSEAERRRLHRSGWDLIFENRVNDWGTTGFHSGISTLTSLLECMTLEGWSALMYRQADGDATTRGLLSLVLFLSVVIVGNLLLMNLVVAVVWENTILKSTTLKKIDAREEDLQLFEVLGMKWVRYLVEQLCRHDIFSSEEKMVSYQRVRYEARRNKERLRTTCITSVSSTTVGGAPAAAEPHHSAAGSPCSAVAYSAAISGHDPSAGPSARGGPSPASFRASAGIICDTVNLGTSSVLPSPTNPVNVIAVPKASNCSRANPPCVPHSSSILPPSGAGGATLFNFTSSDATAFHRSCAPSAATAPLSSASRFVHRLWSRFSSRVLYAISRKQYVVLMFFIALVDLCCIVALTWTNQESVRFVTDCGFTLIYGIDICLQLIGFGWCQFLRDGFKVYDLIVVLMEVAGLLFHFGCCGGALSVCTADRVCAGDPTLVNVYAFFRSFHAFRIFRLIRNFAALRILVELTYDLLRNIFFIYALVLFEVFTMSLMGVICFRDSHYEERAAEVNFPTITLFFNFSNIWKAFMLVYGLMTGESWNVVMSELFAVYVNNNYSPSEAEALLPSHLFLKSPRPAYIITTYVFITVIFLCCFIYNVFGGILIGQYVVSRRSVYNRHVFKLLKICRELNIEMPSSEVVGSTNLQRMYSLVQPQRKGLAARKRALSLFLQPEKIQQRLSVAGASPRARKIMTRMSSSFSKPRPFSLPLNLAHPQGAGERSRKTAAATPHSTRRGSRRKRLRVSWRVTHNRRVLPQLRLRKARALHSVKQRHEVLSMRTQCISLTDAGSLTTSQGSFPPEASTLTENKTVWAISTSAKTQSFLFYTVSHEDFAQKSKSPQEAMAIGKRFCSSIRAVCLSLAIASVWIFDAVVRLFSFCLLLLESQLVSLDIDRPDFCVAYVRYILEDEDIVGQEGEREQGSTSSISLSAQQRPRGGVRSSTCSSCSQRRATAEVPCFKPGGFVHSFLYRLMVSHSYGIFLATVNVASLLCLIVEASLTRNATAGFCFACFECIFAGFFFLENALRMAVFGRLGGATRANVLNFALSLLSVILLFCNQVWLLSPSLQAAYAHLWETPAFRTVKLLRSMRALQLVDALRMDGIRIVARSLAASIGEVKNLAVLLVLVFLVAAVSITQIMFFFNFTSSTSGAASASSGEIRASGTTGRENSTTKDVAVPTDINRSVKVLEAGGARSSNTAYSMPRSIMNSQISTASSLAVASAIPDVHGERSDRSRAAAYTFENMAESLLGVFVLSTAEGWPLLLTQLLQQQPEQQRTILAVLIVVFVSLVAIICVNLFVGIIVETSRRKKTRMEMQGSLLSPAIHKWIEVQKILFDAPLQHGDTVPDFDLASHKHLAWFRKKAAAIVTSSYYHYFDLSQIFLFCLLLLFYGPWYDVLMGHIARTTDRIFCSVAVVLCGCFVAGVVLKLVARGRFFFRDKLDILDLLICMVFVARVLVGTSFKEQRRHLELHPMSAFWPFSFRLFRVTRFLYRHVYFFRTLFTTITGVARAFLTALGLLGIALFFFALWGVLLFHDSPIREYTTKYANFTNLLAAFMAVIGACTGEDWHLVLQQMRLHYAHERKTTLEYFVVVFFVAFIILVFFTLMSLFTSTVLEKYMETVRNESLWKISRQHRRLLDLWMPDEDGTLFKSPAEALRILQSIDFPVGLRDAVPQVETAEAAFALLAKFELPLYYCCKAESSPTCDLNNSNPRRDTWAAYKVHIRDVVLNAARRACKFHAASNGEGVLQEGRVTLDPRVTQSWLAKFPELNRIGCVYDLKHFNAATTIQGSWRRRHVLINGHIASPEWCKRYIVTLMRRQVANRIQRPAGRTRRDSLRGEGDRGRRRSSADSSSYSGTVVASEADFTRKKNSHMGAARQETWMTSSTVFDGSPRPSFARRRSKGEKEAPKRQLAVSDVTVSRSPPASSIGEQSSTHRHPAVLKSSSYCQTSTAAQPAQSDITVVDVSAGVEEMQFTASKSGRRRTSAAPCAPPTSLTCPDQTHTNEQTAQSEGGGEPGGAGQVPLRPRKSERRRTSAAPCPAVTSPTWPDQTHINAHSAQRQTDELAAVSEGVGQRQPRARKSGGRRTGAAPSLAATSAARPRQTVIGTQSAKSDTDEVGAVCGETGQVQPRVPKSGRRRTSAVPCAPPTSPTCPGQTHTNEHAAQRRAAEGGGEPGGVGQVQLRPRNSEPRRISAAPCPAVTSSTCPDQTHINAHSAQRQTDELAAVSEGVGQLQPRARKSGGRRTGAAPSLAATSSTCPGQTFVGTQSAQRDTDEVGAVCGETGQVQPRVPKSGRRRTSAVPCAPPTSPTCPGQTDVDVQLAQSDVDVVDAVAGRPQPGVAKAARRRDSAAPCLAVPAFTWLGQTHRTVPPPQREDRVAGTVSGGITQAQASAAKSVRRRATAPCPAVASAVPPLSYRSPPETTCEKRRASEALSPRSPHRGEDRAAVTVDNKRLSRSAYKQHSHKRRPHTQGQHESSQNDYVAYQTSPLKQPGVHRGGFGRHAADETNEAVSRQGNSDFRVGRRECIPEDTTAVCETATYRSVGGPGARDDYVCEASDLPGHTVVGPAAETPVEPPPVSCACRPARGVHESRFVDFNREALASPRSTKRSSTDVSEKRPNSGSMSRGRRSLVPE